MESTDIDQIRDRRVRKMYDRDFKLQVVRRVTQGTGPAQLARDLGMSPIMVARWLREWHKDPAHAFRGYGHRKPLQGQMERLRREVRKLRAERDLLKKASARFALTPEMSSDSLQNIERSGR